MIRHGFAAVAAAFLLIAAAACTPAPPPAEAPRPDAPPAMALDTAIARQVDAVFEEWDNRDTPGCVVGVGRDGAVLYEAAYGMANLEHEVPLTTASVLEIGSVSKQFATAAVLMLEQDGELSLDDDVRDYIPELHDFGETITLRQLAGHTSGLRDQWGLLRLMGSPPASAVHTIPLLLNLITRQETLNFPPGDRYLYSNAGYTLLNVVVERVSGQTLAEFSDERLFGPLELRQTEWRDDHQRIVADRAVAHTTDDNGGYRTLMPFTNAYGNGGLLTTVADMLRWTHLLHEDRVGEPGFRDAMLRRGVLNDGRETEYAVGIINGEYRGLREVSHGGATAGYRAFLTHYPDEGLSVALACNVTAVNSGELARGVAGVFLEDRMEARHDPEDPDPTPLERREMERLAGLYRNPVTQQHLRVEVEDGLLATSGAFSMDLIPLGENRFRRAGRAAEYVIEPVDGGGLELREEVDQPDPEATFQVVTAADPAPEALEQYVGTYRSPELDTTYEVALEDGGLMVRRHLMDDWTLEPTFEDAFAADEGALIFERGDDGTVESFGYYLGRVRDLHFEREAR